MKANKKIIILAILVVAVALKSCKKISVPDPNAERIFGEWKYSGSSGGFTGGGTDLFGKNTTIAFKETGEYFVYDNWRPTHYEKFRFETGRSIITGNEQTIIVYSKGHEQSFRVVGDTLFLADEAYDGMEYVFLRK